MARVLGLVLLLALSGGVGAVEGFLSGDDLYASCQEKNPACEGYIVAISDSVQALATWGDLPDNFICRPADVTSEQLVAVVIKDFEKYPEQRHLLASNLVIYALKQAFPCK